jgi:hypothetical protein
MRLAARVGLTTALLIALMAPSAQAARSEVVVSGHVLVPRGETVDTVFVIDGPVTIAGHVQNDVFAINSDVTISGTVDGSVTTVVKRLRLLPGARVAGNVHYDEKKPVIARGAVVSGDVSHQNWRSTAGIRWLFRLILWATVTVSTLILGLVLLAFAPRAAESAWVIAQQRTGVSIAWAAGLFFGVPIVAIVAMVTVVGLPLGIALLLAYLPLAFVGYVTSCWLLGMVMRRQREWGRPRTFLAGWGVLRLLALVPYLGVALWIAAAAFGLGVLLVTAWYSSNPDRVMRREPAPAPTPG